MSAFTTYLVVGFLVILSAWVPLFVWRLPVSLPMLAVGIGVLLAMFTNIGDPYGNHTPFALHLGEFALLVSVFGAGLKIDRPFSFRGWVSTWRMLVLVMPLSIAASAAAGYWLLGLAVGPAVLLGAMLAPTDPVLASGFGTGPPGKGDEGESKFTLTSEAGLNDGLAFPFVALGLAWMGAGAEYGLLHWALIDLVWDVVGGVLVGVALGGLLVAVNALLPESMRLSASNSGLVAVGLAFLAYSLAVAIDANGFVAVFCQAVALRNFSSRYEYSQRLNHAAEQFERLSMVGILVFLGVSIFKGQFAHIGIPDLVFMAVVLLAVRPVAVLLGCIGSGQDRWARAALGYFGIRGIASLYYVTYVAPRLSAGAADHLTSVVSLVVLASVVLYGTTAGAAGRLLIQDVEQPGEESAEEASQDDDRAAAHAEPAQAGQQGS